MALLQASLANVYQSLDAYLGVALVDAQGAPLALRPHGVRRFVPPADAPWVEAHYDFLGLGDTYLGLAGPSLGGTRPYPIGTARSGYLQLNCYQRARVFRQRYTTAAVRDLVVDAFPDGGLIPIHDWSQVTDSGGEPIQEAVLVINGCKDHVQDMGLESGLVQHIVQIATRYWELTTRA